MTIRPRGDATSDFAVVEAKFSGIRVPCSSVSLLFWVFSLILHPFLGVFFVILLAAPFRFVLCDFFCSRSFIFLVVSLGFVAVLFGCALRVALFWGPFRFNFFFL